MSDSVRELCTRIASGDPEALSRFYRERFDWLYAAARRATGRDESFCLDLVQETMLRVIRSLPPSIECEGELRAWLWRVVRGCALDALRAEARRKRREALAAHNDSAADSRAGDALDERIAWLRSELEGHGEETASLIRLRHALGCTLARVGRAFNLSAGAVDGRINRALSAMRERGRENFDEP